MGIRGYGTGRAAFALVEVMVGTVILGFVFVSVYLGFSSAFSTVQLARENFRATQMMMEKMEEIRLCRWDQITDPTFVRQTFTAPYYTLGKEVNNKIVFHGRLTITNAPVTEAYADDLRLVIVELRWRSGGVQRYREMQTLVSAYGVQSYSF